VKSYESNLQMEKNIKILFIGDSITDSGRREQAYSPFGRGYVHFVANWVLAKYSDLNPIIINQGISGNTIRDLKARWQSDCLDYKPNLISILIGINDVWRFHREPQRIPDAVPPDEYEGTYRYLLFSALEQNNCRLILLEPFMFCTDLNNLTFKNLDIYIHIVRKLSEEFNVLLIPVQKLLNDEMQRIPAKQWACDMVHPHEWAHAWIAQRWLEYLEL